METLTKYEEFNRATVGGANKAREHFHYCCRQGIPLLEIEHLDEGHASLSWDYITLPGTYDELFTSKRGRGYARFLDSLLRTFLDKPVFGPFSFCSGKVSGVPIELARKLAPLIFDAYVLLIEELHDEQ